jgi:hypothetical protein
MSRIGDDDIFLLKYENYACSSFIKIYSKEINAEFFCIIKDFVKLVLHIIYVYQYINYWSLNSSLINIHSLTTHIFQAVIKNR